LFLRGIGGSRVKAVHGLGEVYARYGELITDVEIPEPGQPAGSSYEGEGYLILRHPRTDSVEEALDFIASRVRVEMVQ
jgi:CO/xanthine dehydrogenase FAD-binding subunit